MHIVRANGIRLSVAVTGPAGAPAIVFSNPLGTDLRIWEPLLAHMPAARRLVRYDKRGHGLSDDGPSPITLDDHVDDLLGILDALGIDKAFVVGASLGGMIAQGIAARAPDRVTGIALIGTAHRIGTAEGWSERIRVIETGGLAAVADGTMERWFSPAYRATHADQVIGWRNLVLRGGVTGYLRSCAVLRDADIGAATQTIKVPALALCGSLDPTVPPEAARATAELIAGARFSVLDGLAHMAIVEAPDRVAAALLPFMDRPAAG